MGPWHWASQKTYLESRICWVTSLSTNCRALATLSLITCMYLNSVTYTPEDNMVVLTHSLELLSFLWSQPHVILVSLWHISPHPFSTLPLASLPPDPVDKDFISSEISKRGGTILNTLTNERVRRLEIYGLYPGCSREEKTIHWLCISNIFGESVKRGIRNNGITE